MFRKPRRVLLAGETLFLVVADQFRPAVAGDAHQRDAGIVRAGGAEAGKIERLAARELVAQPRQRFARNVAVEAVDGPLRVEPREQRQREAEAGGAEAGKAGTGTHG